MNQDQFYHSMRPVPHQIEMQGLIQNFLGMRLMGETRASLAAVTGAVNARFGEHSDKNPTTRHYEINSIR